MFVPVLVPGGCILLFALLVLYWGHRLAVFEAALDDLVRWDTLIDVPETSAGEGGPWGQTGFAACALGSPQAPLRPMALESYQPPGLAMARERLVQVQEDERRLLAAELHDDIGQQLCGLKLQLHRLTRLTPSESEAQHLSRELNGVVDELIASVRRLSLGLHPLQLERLGLVAAMHAHLDRLCADSHLSGRLDTSGELENLSPANAAGLFRIFQESLGNVVRHAHASRVRIRVQGRVADIHLEVEDDGVGFDVEGVSQRTSSLGLTSMRERAAALDGRLQIQSRAGEGTCMRVLIPRKTGQTR